MRLLENMPTKNKIVFFLFVCFSILFVIFPFSVIISSKIVYFGILFLIIGLGMFLLKKWSLFSKFEKIHWNSRKVAFFLFVFSLIIHVIIVVLLEPSISQMSDFKIAYNQAMNPAFQTAYHTAFTHWILYPELLHLVFQIFGASQLVALIFNAVVVSFFPPLVYLIGKKIFKKELPAFIGGILVLLWPINQYWTLILAPDHIACLLLLVGIYALLQLHLFEQTEEPVSVPKMIFFSIFVGVVIAFGPFFKDFSSVLLVAIPLMMMFTFIIVKNKKKYLPKLGILILIFGSFIGCKQLILLHLDQSVGRPVFRSNLPFYFNMGLNLPYQGSYDDIFFNEFLTIIEEADYQEDVVNKQLKERLFTNIKKDYRSYLALFYHKTLTDFVDEDIKTYFLRASLKEGNEATSSYLLNWVRTTSVFFYYAVLILSVCYVIGNTKRQDRNGLFICLFLFGVSLEFLFVEAQGRYRYAIEPIFALLAGGGFYQLLTWFQTTKVKFPRAKIKDENLV